MIQYPLAVALGMDALVALFIFLKLTTMPVPIPKDKDKKADYISRCMRDDKMNEEFPVAAQRLAVCATKWKDSLKG